MRVFSRLFSVLLIVLVLAAAVPFTASAAANAVISVSSSSLSIGDTLTATFTFSADTVGAVDASVSYDPTVLEFVSGNDAAGAGGTVRLAGYATSEVKSLRFTLTFKALKAGSSTLRIGNSTVYGWDESLLGNPTAGTTVTVKDAALSQNANLKSLSLSAGTLSPAFSANTTVYTLSVNNYITSVAITAVAADSGASVKISGSKELAVGANKRTVTVTAPGGAVKVYTVTITRRPPTSATSTTTATTTAPADPLYLDYNGMQYLVDTAPADTIPEDFAAARITVDGKTAPALRSENGKICLLWLTDKNDSGRLVLYDEASGRIDDYRPFTVGNATFLLLFPDTAPYGLTMAERMVGDQSMDTYVFPEADRADFVVVWCVTADGNRGWYCIDTAENTVQRYLPQAPATTLQTTTTAPTTTAKPTLPVLQTTVQHYLPWAVAGGLALVCVALIILLIVNHRSPHSKSTPAPKH